VMQDVKTVHKAIGQRLPSQRFHEITQAGR
jgi:hypothetical protein